MKRSVSLLLSVIFAGVLMTSCKDDRYVASVTELQLASVSPATGYSGGIIKILGRNFSDVFGENRVFIGDLEAQVLEYNPWDLTVVLPAQEPGTYVITVQTPKGTISGLTFDYKEKPEHEYITSIVAGGAIGFADGNGASAKIHQPEGIAMDPSGNFWITQRGTSGHAIRKMDRSFNVTTVLETELPWQCCFDKKGDFYFTAKDKNWVGKITPDGTFSQLSLTGAEIKAPMDVEFDKDGAMWVVSRNNNKVYKFVNNAKVTEWDLNYPTCLSLDRNGRMIIGSTLAGYMYMEKDGELVPIAGNGDNSSVNNPDGTAGDTSTAYVGQINGVYAAKDGSIWFTDVRHQTVRKLTPDASGDYAKGKIETIAKGFYPSDLYVTDDCMKVYVTSATSHTVRLIEIF